MNIKNTLLAIVGFIPFLSGCSNLPLEVPIDLSRAGNVVEFEAVASDDYFAMAEIRFYMPDYVTKNPKEEPEIMRQRHEIQDFVGNWAYEKDKRTGEVVPLNISIHKLTKTDKELIFDETFDTKGEDGLLRGDRLLRTIKGYPLKKGKYLVRIETLKDIEFLKDKKCTIYFGYHTTKA
jgi:hypothetical protein